MEMRRQCDQGGRERFEDADLEDWSDAAISQGMPAATRVGRGKEGLSPRASGGIMALSTLWYRSSGSDFGLLASRTVTEYISVVLSHPVCSHLLQQAQQMNASTTITWIFLHSYCIAATISNKCICSNNMNPWSPRSICIVKKNDAYPK